MDWILKKILFVKKYKKKIPCFLRVLLKQDGGISYYDCL